MVTEGAHPEQAARSVCAPVVRCCATDAHRAFQGAAGGVTTDYQPSQPQPKVQVCDDSHHNQYGCHQDGYHTYRTLVRFPSSNVGAHVKLTPACVPALRRSHVCGASTVRADGSVPCWSCSFSG
jgi:hypothetical protein